MPSRWAGRWSTPSSPKCPRTPGSIFRGTPGSPSCRRSAKVAPDNKQSGNAMLTRRALMAGAGTTLFAGAAAAQSDRTVRIIAGFPPGGGIDISARLLVDPMKDGLGLPTIVENRTGAAGMIAANAVAKAAPDGHMMLMATSGEIAIAHHLYKERMTYDPLRELAPVALIGIVPCVVVVSETTPVHNPQELIAYA